MVSGFWMRVSKGSIFIGYSIVTVGLLGRMKSSEGKKATTKAPVIRIAIRNLV